MPNHYGTAHKKGCDCGRYECERALLLARPLTPCEARDVMSVDPFAAADVARIFNVPLDLITDVHDYAGIPLYLTGALDFDVKAGS